MVLNAFERVAKTATSNASAGLVGEDFLDLSEKPERQAKAGGNNPERVAREIFGRSSADPEKGKPA